MHVEICEKCRRIRLVLMAVLIVVAALAGYHWGSILEFGNGPVHRHDVLIAAIFFTVLALAVALWVEAVVTRTEREAAAAQLHGQRKAEEADISKEHARELNRIVSMLAADNSDLRYQLLSSKIHEVGADMARENRAEPVSFPELRAKAS